mmetsp:Transcript_64231/g.186219  ORF Transcript_64231/g.186219 Transcript_64231/m.186219 type:complete len:205 (+) Transcript_64231:1219-1833(+)
MKLFFLHPIITVAVLQSGLLVCAHERGLGIQPLGPDSIPRHLDDELVDLCEAYDIVPIEIEATPKFLQVGCLDEAVLPHVCVQRHAQLHKHVVARWHRSTSDLWVRPPLIVVVAKRPRVVALLRRLAVAGLHKGPAFVAIVHDLADDPPALAGVEEVAGRHPTRHKGGHTVMLDLHGLVNIVDEREPCVRRAALDLDCRRHRYC